MLVHPGTLVVGIQADVVLFAMAFGNGSLCKYLHSDPIGKFECWGRTSIYRPILDFNSTDSAEAIAAISISKLNTHSVELK